LVRVTVDNLVKKFGEVVAVDHVSFEATEGSILTLLGPSGCGKTTILRCIAGLEVPDNGSIYFDGLLVASEKISLPPERRNVGMVFQSYAVWPHMTVYDNIAYPLKIRKMSRSEIKNRVTAILNVVRLAGLEDRYPSQLSGGQQQRVALARALVYDPKVLLLDEPLSNLDAKLREGMRLELKEIQKKLGVTTIYVTHDQIEAIVLSDKIVILDKGRIQQIGTPKELYESPANKFVADFIGFSNLIEGKIVSIDEKSRLTAVDTQIGRLICYTTLNLREGDSVLVAIRPENITFGGEGYKAKIVSTAFIGDALVCWLKVSDIILSAKVHTSLNLSCGDEVCIQLQPAYCKLVKL
jgi:iron(III) transport system ATP-binding protein